MSMTSTRTPQTVPIHDGLEPIERASHDELASIQLDRLKAILHHAYARVPLYRTRFDAAGVHPDDLRELPDLARFPFTVKDDLRQSYPFGMLAVAREPARANSRVVRNHGTADRRGVHACRHRHVGAARRAIDASGGCATR